MTTRVQSVSIPVADEDRALAFYTEVLGCELRTDIEVWPGARLVEVVPPGSSVGLVLLPPDSEIPMAVRLGTTNAETAYARLRQAGARLHNDEVLHLDVSPPMFFFADPDGNGLVYLEEEPTLPLPAIRPHTQSPAEAGRPAHPITHGYGPDRREVMTTFTGSDDLQGAEFVDANLRGAGSAGLTCPAS